MADIEVSYKNAVIKQQTGSGTVTLHTEGKYMEDDVDIVYTAPAGGGGTVEITSFTSTNTTICGSPITGIKKLNIKAGSAAATKYCNKVNLYGAHFAELVDIVYSGCANYTSGSSITDQYRSPKNINSVDFGGAYLPATMTRCFYLIEKCDSADWIPHTTYIKGLRWDNVTTMTNCFQADTTHATCVTNGQYIDIDFGSSEISGNLNFAPSANYFPFTHATLLSLISCLKNGVSGTVKIGQSNLDSLSAAEIAVATAKGWTISA